MEVACDVPCQRFYIVYRMGLALATYHGLQALLLVGVDNTQDPRASIQEAFWPLKLILLAGLTVAMFFLPSWFLDVMFVPTLLMGVLFLMVQAVLLVDLAYNWAESMLDKVAEGRDGFKVLLIGSTGGLAIAAAAVIISIFAYFERELERTLISVNAVLFIVMSVCSVLPMVQDATPSSGIFQSSLLGLYSLLVITSAFINDPTRPRGPDALMITYPLLGKLVSVFSVVYAFLAVAHAALSTGSNLHRMVPDAEKSASLGDESDETVGEYNYSLFHVSFMMAAFYTILYVTFWQYGLVQDGKLVIIDSSLAFWSRVVSSWLVAGLYIWSLFAPIFLEDRF